MNRLMHLLARIAIRAPAVTLGVLLTLTLVLGAAAGNLEVDTGVEGFAPEGGVADTLDDIGERFEAASSVQVLLDAGPGGDVLERDVLVAVDQLAQTLRGDPVIAPVLAPERTGREPIATFALPFASAAETQDQTLAEFNETSAALLIEGVLDAALDQIEPLFSDDLELAPPRARSGLVSVAFDTNADSEDRAAAARQVAALVDEAQLDGLRSSVLSITAIEDGIEAALERDLPVLLGTSLLLVLLVLAWLFRSVADVVVGFLGLIASIVWMIGFSALLGPGGLGVLGAFNQIGIAIPVLLVGLGIDYSVHLTTRYREQRARGDDPDRAAYVTLVTVGVALILATIASVAGFLANVATPLPPIRDFGILAAIGIVAAFLILGGAVPATRTLIDRRLDRRAARRAAEADTAAVAAANGDALPPPSDVPTPPLAAPAVGRDPLWVRATAALATRHAAPALAVAALVVAVSSVVASGLDTEFNERDFLPEGDPIVATLDRLDAQFGGDVGERTYVLVDGDPEDAQLLGAAAELAPRLVDIDGVRLVGDRAEVVSPFELVERYAELGEQTRDALAADLEAWDDPVAAAAEVDLPDPIDPDLVDDDDVELPADLEQALSTRLPDGRSPLAALVATSDPDELATSVREAIAQGIAEDRPAGLSDADLAALAALPAAELSLATLAGGGLPDEVLSDDDRELLRILDDLEAAGYDPATGPDAVEDDAWPDLLDVLARHAPDALADVLDDQGLLMIVSSAAGPDGADRLAADLEAAAAPVAATGAQVTVVSDPLVQAEIISSLSAAQLLAILISLASAAVLLVGATLLTSRSVGLGLIGIVPSVVALSLVLGTMRLIGLSFNALTATVASIAVGIGVPYGIHLINRFREARSRGMLAEVAIGDSLRNTGPALIGSAVTTGLAFAVLTLSESTPVVQFGQVSTLMIGYALLACLLVQPALLVLWGRRRDVLGR